MLIAPRMCSNKKPLCIRPLCPVVALLRSTPSIEAILAPEGPRCCLCSFKKSPGYIRTCEILAKHPSFFPLPSYLTSKHTIGGQVALPAFEVFFFFAGACAPPRSRSISVGDRYQRLLHVLNEPLLWFPKIRAFLRQFLNRTFWNPYLGALLLELPLSQNRSLLDQFRKFSRTNAVLAN